MNRFATDGVLNVLILCKGGERYIWLFADGEEPACLRSITAFAEERELSFSPSDAKVLFANVKEIARCNR